MASNFHLTSATSDVCDKLYQCLVVTYCLEVSKCKHFRLFDTSGKHVLIKGGAVDHGTSKVRSRSLCTWENRNNLGQFIRFLDQNDRHSLDVLLIY